MYFKISFLGVMPRAVAPKRHFAGFVLADEGRFSSVGAFVRSDEASFSSVELSSA